MYRWILTSAVLLLFAAAPAAADVDVNVKYDKDKDVTVEEKIKIKKKITIDVTVDKKYKQAAEAEALINQENKMNKACTNCAEKRDRIIDSLNNSNGVISVNQAVGNNNNQAAAVAISVDREYKEIPPSNGNGETPPKAGRTFANAQAAVEQDNGGFCFKGNVQDSKNIEEKSAVMKGSLKNNKGVANVNQASGNMANQANSLAMAVGFGEGGSALAEADLGQSNMGNMVLESGSAEWQGAIGAFKFVKIQDSIVGNSGIISLNQTSGYMANQANVTSFAVVIAGSSD